MKSQFIYLLLLFNIDICHAQEFWEKIISNKAFLTEDIAMDSNGICYIAVKGHNDIYKVDILQDELRYIRLPDVWQPYFALIHSKKIWINRDGGLVNYFIYGGTPLPYYLINDSFYPAVDYSDTTLQPFATTTEKFNRSGEYYFSSLNEIYKYRELWDFKGIERVFSLSNGENLIADYFPFSKENNYVVVLNVDNTFSIYNFSTETGKKEKLIHTNLPVVSNKVVITEDGNIFLPTTNGLYHYFDNGNSLNVPIVDTVIGPYTNIADLRQSKRGDALIVRTNGNFYFSYDTGKTWTKPINFNINFPSENILKMEIWDSLHAVAFFKYGCFEEQSFVLSNERKGWAKIDPGISYLDLTQIFKTGSGRLFALENNCDFIYSDDDGIDWKPLLIKDNPIRNLLKISNDNFLAWNYGDSILNFSTDLGENWISNNKFEGEILNVTNLFDLTVFLVSITGSRGPIPKYNYYLSLDGGQSWILQSKSSFPKINTKRLVWDKIGNIVSYASNSTIVYKSNDFGKSWEVDPRFLNMKIFDLIFTETNNVFINGVIENKRGIFISEDYKIFQPISEVADEIKYFDNGILVAYSIVDGIHITRNYGKSWDNLIHNLPLDAKVRTTIYNDFYLDEKGIGYLSLGYDGLYKTNEVLVGVEKIVKKRVKIKIYPNPTKSLLNIELGDEMKDLDVFFEMRNSLGQLVWNQKFNFANSVLDISILPIGVYHLELECKGELIYSNRLVKF